MLLRDIHLKGKVAQYESKLQGPMDRWFSKLSPNTLAERNNYFFQVFNPDDDPQRAMAQLHEGSLKPKVVAAQDPRSLAIRGDAGQAALRDAVSKERSIISLLLLKSSPTDIEHPFPSDVFFSLPGRAILVPQHKRK